MPGRARGYTSRVAAAGHDKGLRDMEQGSGDGLAPNLFAVTKSARTDSGSRSHEHVGVLFSRSSDEEARCRER
jgi:hypothetical protein